MKLLKTILYALLAVFQGNASLDLIGDADEYQKLMIFRDYDNYQLRR